MALLDTLKNWKTWVAGASLAGVLWLGAKVFDGETIFDGTIDDNRVEYIEDLGVLFNGENKMTFEKDGKIYVFYDSYGEHNINWNSNSAPFYKADKVDSMRLTNELGRVYFLRRDDDLSTLQGKTSHEMFQKADEFYNSIRRKIRDKKRREYEEGLSGLRQGLQ